MTSFRFFCSVILACLCSLIDVGECQGQVPYFSILAPQFLCSSGTNDTDYTPPDSITIALQTRGSQRLTYRVQVFFRLLNGFKSQRHTLSVWRSIRVLEKKIRDTKEAISNKNQIDILNEELIPGVEYTFSIVGVDDKGNVSPAQNFTITYRGTDSIGFNQGSGSSGADISFLLVGTWSIFRDMPFLMQGVIIFCDPIPYYKFYWNMSGLSVETKEYTKTNSKTLLIPGGLLSSGSSHQVAVEVKADDSVIAKAHGTLQILARDFHIQMVPNNQSIGINREIKYSVYVDMFETGQKQMSVIWTCEAQAHNQSCAPRKNEQNPLTASFAFSKAGLYWVTVSVALNGSTKNDSTYVEVKPNIIASVEVLWMDPFKVVAGESFVAQVRINYLIPQCSAEWHSVGDDPTYQSLNTSQLEAGLGKMTLNDLEESFLSELIEYENDTSSYDLKLSVPESSAGFRGFVGNGVYLFRLAITCPGLFDEDGNAVNASEPVNSYSELIVRSNDPPTVEDLDVSPKTGEALKTLFKFSTAPAIDSPGDYPLRYRFYYRVDEFWVLIGDFYENTVTSAELPYLKSGTVKTMYSVCDSRNACTSGDGPKVEVTRNSFMSQPELTLRMNALEQSLLRKDFSDVFEKLVCLIWSIYTWDNQSQISMINETTPKLLKVAIADVIQKYKSGNAYERFVAKRTLQEWLIIAGKVSSEHLRSTISEVLFEPQVAHDECC